MRRDEVLIPITLVVLVLAGMIISSAPGIYTYDIEFEVEDNQVGYFVTSDIGAEVTTVVVGNSGQYDINYVAAYVDTGYAALNSWQLQIEMFEDMRTQLAIRSINGFGMYDSESLLKVMDTYDPTTTAVFIASGSISDILYDGTPECPLMRWLQKGGILINTSGCLGAYVSHGPNPEDVERVFGFGNLFAGVPDFCFNDSGKVVYGSAGCNEIVRDALHFYMNECTYGINIQWMSDCLNLGYYSYDGYSAAAVFRCGAGMVMNFGVSLYMHEHSDHYVAQIIASGLDYSSEILGYEVGDTQSDNSGMMEVEGYCRVYCFIGSTRAVYAEFVNVPV